MLGTRRAIAGAGFLAAVAILGVASARVEADPLAVVVGSSAPSNAWGDVGRPRERVAATQPGQATAIVEAKARHLPLAQSLLPAEPPTAASALPTEVWLHGDAAKPDLFEEFTNYMTSNRQRYLIGVAISEYTITGLRAAVRF